MTDRLARLLLVTLEAARLKDDVPVLGALRSWARLLVRHRPRRLSGWPDRVTTFNSRSRREGLARDVLHDRDGALANECDRFSVGADTVARGSRRSARCAQTCRRSLRLPNWVTPHPPKKRRERRKYRIQLDFEIRDLRSRDAELSVGDLPHRLSECGQRHSEPLHQGSVGRERRINLTHQHVRTIHQLVTIRDKFPRGVSHFSCLQPHDIRKHCAAVEMAAHTVGQIYAAARTRCVR
jgi:hypothetical protein